MSTIVYVSNAASGDICVMSLEESAGKLTELQRVQVGGKLMPMAVSPDKRVLYVARRSDPLAVVALQIDSASGHLSPLGEAALPASMAWISTDATGRWLFSASYGGNVVAVNSIGTDGRPSPAHQQIPTDPKAHCMRAAPGNRHVFATSLGGGVVLQFRFNDASGRLTPNEPALLGLSAASGPRHLVFHPQQPIVALLNELDASLDLLSLDRERGTLKLLRTVSTLPPGFSGEAWASDLHFTPDGRFLYTSERRSNTLAGFAVDGADASLKRLGHWPTQAQPRGFAISPSGRFLVAAGGTSHKLGLHAIDAASGALTLVHEVDAGREPNWVEIVELA